MKSKTNLEITGNSLNVPAVASFVRDNKQKLKIPAETLDRVRESHEFLSQTLEKNDKVIYGINTGFGPMASYILARGQILDLQKNLILSHAVGMGEKIRDDFVLAAMLLRLNMLAKSYSGVSPELLEHLERLINLRIIPVVPEHGAVGTSGDLVQLAHIGLALLGKGEVVFKGQIQKTSAVFRLTGIKPYSLKPKEGLSLINGTSMMTGIASIILDKSRDLLSLALRNGCLALGLVKAYDDSFNPKLHQLRAHPGQLKIASKMKQILEGSKRIHSRESLNRKANVDNKVHHIHEHVQEVYSLRCLAQILGPVYETMAKTWQTVEIEMNSVTDNPIIDTAGQKFLHGGNFHGDYIAVAMDQLKAGLVKLTMLSERRLNFFLHDKINELFPPFLNLNTPGLTLGLQGLQFVATSTTANSQTLAFPMNLHSIPSNGDNQDVVSMGTDAALLAGKVLDNAFVVLTIESLALCQAVDYLKAKNQLSKASKQLYDFVRHSVPTVVQDRHLQPELQTLLAKIKTWPELNLFDKF